MNDLEDAVNSLNEPKCGVSSDSSFSQEYIDYSDKLSFELANQPKEKNSEKSIDDLTRSLASYGD